MTHVDQMRIGGIASSLSICWRRAKLIHRGNCLLRKLPRVSVAFCQTRRDHRLRRSSEARGSFAKWSAYLEDRHRKNRPMTTGLRKTLGRTAVTSLRDLPVSTARKRRMISCRGSDRRDRQLAIPDVSANATYQVGDSAGRKRLLATQRLQRSISWVRPLRCFTTE